MTIENPERRFGITAVEKGFITPDELIKALKVQVMEDLEKKNHRLIGTILFDLELIETSQFVEVLKSMDSSKFYPPIE